MRTFSSGVRRALNRKQGIEPVIFIGVEWVPGKTLYYCSQDFPGTRKSVVSISGLETTTLIQGSSASQSVQVVLSDTDGHLSQMMDAVDIHKRPAKVYMGFPDLPLTEAVVLLDGEVNSQILLDERARTLSLTILSKIEGRLFGFSSEDGLFQDVDSQTRNLPWPFRFGSTCSYPAVEIRSGRTGVLRIGQGVLDATLDAKICQAQKITCPLIESPTSVPNEPSQGENLQRARSDLLSAGPFNTPFDQPFGTRLSVLGGNDLGTSPSGRKLVRDLECERGKFETLCQLYRDRANQLVYVNDTLLIRGGGDFPQNVTVDIRIDDVVYSGVFSGEVFTIEKTNRLDKPSGVIDCRTVRPLQQAYQRQRESTPGSLADCQRSTNTFELRFVGGAIEAWDQLGEIEDSKFKWLPSGSTVYLESTHKRVHVVSMVPGTVTGVFAYRKFGDTSQLTEVPASYYEVVTTNYGDLEVVEIWLDRSLASYPDENWQERLYVQFTSSVGPNPVDVIQWIVEKYTDFSIDAANFAAVKPLLAKYPCNYYHARKENVLTTLEAIAYEARTAITITDNVVKLKYLAAEPPQDKTLTNADIVAGSFKTLLTPSEDIVTASEVTWEAWGASLLSTDSHVRSFSVENNVSRYGFSQQSRVYRSINNEEQALKTATFWSSRDSNTWKEIQFSTTLEHMDIELFDTLLLNTTLFPNVKVVVSSVQVDVQNGTVQLQCWTPILSGTNVQAQWAWPASQPGGRPYPNNSFEIELPPIAITPPVGHPLYIEGSNPPTPATRGDRFPSDADDVFPTTVCQDMNDSALIDAIEPIFNTIGFPTDIRRQSARAAETSANGLNFSGGGSDKNRVCGRNSFEACVWEVTVQHGTATSIAPAEGSGIDDCDIQPGACNTTSKGARCSGPTFFWCKTFGSESMAQAYADSIRAEIDTGYCNWRTGNTGPVSVQGPIMRASGDDPSCVGVGNTEVAQGPGN